MFGIKEEKKDENPEKKDENLEKKEGTNDKKDNNIEKPEEKNENINNETILTNKEHKNEDKSSGNKEEKKEVTEKKQKTEKKETSKKSYQIYTVKSGDNLAGIANDYDVTIGDIKDWNNLSSDKILVGQKLKIYSDKKVTSSSNKNATTYTVKSGDNLTIIAEKYSVTVTEIKDWNDLESDVIYEGQVLKLYPPKSEKTEKKSEKKAATYTVKAGDNLTDIASKFGVTVKEIKEWNDIESDTIYEGQVLKLYPPKETKKEKKESKSKITYHTVTKGETLAKIADKYNVTVAELKKWNNLKSDTIEIGQKLIVKK
jgi:LysM repeat protein